MASSREQQRLWSVACVDPDDVVGSTLEGVFVVFSGLFTINFLQVTDADGGHQLGAELGV